MDMRRRIDLCTCGKPREDAVHQVSVAGLAGIITYHVFMPNPQPPPLPTEPVFDRIHALRLNGVWVADVYAGLKMGRGQSAESWASAVSVAIEDLKEKS